MVCAAAACLLGVLPIGPHALAYYSAGATGAGAVAAARLAPAPPTATVTTVTFVACFVHVTWSAPPAGQRYSVVRVTTSGETTVQASTAVAGAKDDTILLSALLGGDPSYFVRATLTGTSWTTDSAAVTAAC